MHSGGGDQNISTVTTLPSEYARPAGTLWLGSVHLRAARLPLEAAGLGAQREPEVGSRGRCFPEAAV
jgi:hypothetical protein